MDGLLYRFYLQFIYIVFEYIDTMLNNIDDWLQ